MAKTKYKNWWKYLFVVIAAYTVVDFIANDEIVLSPAPTIEKTATRPLESIIIEQEASEKIEQLTYQFVDEKYEAKPHYPMQHFFDDQLCDLDGVRTDHKPALKKAIDRLDSRYELYSYNITEYLALNVYATGMTTHFEKELNERIKTLHKSYIDMLGVSAKRKIALNIVIMPDRSEYLEYGSFYYKDIDTTLGVYFGGLNIAFVDYQHSAEKALTTVVHESVHILNAHIIGRTPRMFNEGMAELYEHMRIKNGEAKIIIPLEQLTKPSYPLMQFFDDEQWKFLDTGQLYYSSWAWTTFMNSQPIRQQALIHFMKKEQENPCSAFSAGESYSAFNEVYNMFEIDFNEWQESLNSN